MSAVNLFDNVLIRIRGQECLATSVLPGSAMAHWPNFPQLLAELGMGDLSLESFSERSQQRLFLARLVARFPQSEELKPDVIGYKLRAKDIILRQQFQENHVSIIFLRRCSAQLVLETLEALVGRLNPFAHVDVWLCEWDALCRWERERQLLEDILNYVQVRAGANCTITAFSHFLVIPPDLGDFVLKHPSVRFFCDAREISQTNNMGDFDRLCNESATMCNLRDLVNQGIWPTLNVPVSLTNVGILPSQVLALADATRGGRIRLIPATSSSAHVPPSIDDYTSALLGIYRDERIPLRNVTPQSWVAARIDADVSLVTSPESAGAAVTVLPNREIYAGEHAVGNQSWRLGKIGNQPLQWERLDAMAEAGITRARTPECQTCDWRFRCGGLDSSVWLVQGAQKGDSSNDCQTTFDLYCKPRKALFEEAIWDSVKHSSNLGGAKSRELLDLAEDKVSFRVAPDSNKKKHQ